MKRNTKYYAMKTYGNEWTGCIWLGIGTNGGLCERDGEHSGSTKGGEFLDLLREY